MPHSRFFHLCVVAADVSETSPLASRTGWNDLPGELRNQIYEYALVGCRRQLGNLPTNRGCKFNLPVANKQIHKEFSSFDNGRFQVDLDTWEQGIPQEFDYSSVKDFEINWDQSCGFGSSKRSPFYSYVEASTTLSILTQRLIPADGLERLTIRITNISQEICETAGAPLILVRALMPWAEAVQAKLDKAEAEGRKWTVDGEIRLEGKTRQFKKSALNLLELLPSGEWDVDAGELGYWRRQVKRELASRLGVSYMDSGRFAF